MRLAVPIYKLKRKAKLQSREHGVPLHQALDRVAAAEGFKSWSHLASNASRSNAADAILAQVRPGDLLLLGARPGHGKTLLAAELAAKASTLGRTGCFFTLDYNDRDVAGCFATLGLDRLSDAVVVDTSDEICANYVIRRIAGEGDRSFIVLDYLQLLDQRRADPSLERQVTALNRFAKAEGAIIVMISQIDRSFDLGDKAMPDLSDVRLPNPLDLSLFDRTCFLHDGEIRFEAVA